MSHNVVYLFSIYDEMSHNVVYLFSTTHLGNYQGDMTISPLAVNYQSKLLKYFQYIIIANNMTFRVQNDGNLIEKYRCLIITKNSRFFT